MSNNLGRVSGRRSTNNARVNDAPHLSAPIFLAATFNNRRVTVRRNIDYDSTIQLIKAAFPTLSSVTPEDIAVSAYFEEFDDTLQITPDMWPDLLPSLMTVRVDVLCSIPPSVATPNRSSWQAPVSFNVQVSDHNGIKSFNVSPNTTVGDLKNLIRMREPSGIFKRNLHYGDQQLEDHLSLQHYEIVENSHPISVDDDVRLLINSSTIHGHVVRVRLDATVQTLKYILWSRLDVPLLQQDLILAGEVLRDTQKLGDYPLLGNDQVYVQLGPRIAILPSANPSGFNIYAKSLTGIITTYKVVPQMPVDVLKHLMFTSGGLPPDQNRLILGGVQMEDGKTLRDYSIQCNSTLQSVLRLRGRKPVIYLFPPVPRSDITVSLSLVNSWRFSALYPHASIQEKPLGDFSQKGQAATWSVDAKPDGTLHHHDSGRDVAYLFWEALTEPSRPLTPVESLSAITTENTVLFDPSQPQLNPNNSVLLPFEKITAYIDDALIALGLHVEARTSFITYWLPDLSEHQHIALRFLPQAEYEIAAPLSVSPSPDVTIRVFMLFMGVDEPELGKWMSAQAKAEQPSSIWSEIVGADLARWSDRGLFRVLEWGGMEVK